MPKSMKKPPARKARNGSAARAARLRVKAALAMGAARAFSNVFNGLFPLAAQEIPNGSSGHFVRWYLQAFRRELESREAAAQREHGGARHEQRHTH